MTLSDEQWQALKLALPVGSDVRGRVTIHTRFGFFVELGEYPGVNALVLTPDFERAGRDITSIQDFPPIGSWIEAQVLDHVDLTKQIRLHLGPHCKIQFDE